MANIIKKHIRNAGSWLVYAGATMLVANCLFIKDSSNILQFCPLILILAGIIVHVTVLKKDSKY